MQIRIPQIIVGGSLAQNEVIKNVQRNKAALGQHSAWRKSC